jgi:hypothetical protein
MGIGMETITTIVTVIALKEYPVRLTHILLKEKKLK